MGADLRGAPLMAAEEEGETRYARSMRTAGHNNVTRLICFVKGEEVENETH
jgi:hypothetical protein